jgi:enoyl-CoA hydratase
MVSSATDSLVLVERDGDVVTLTFNNPARRNAMSREMGEAFSDQISQLAADESIRAVIVTGAGRAFSAGGDMAMLDDLAAQGERDPNLAQRPIRDTMRSFYGLFLSVRDLPCPTIAAINGHAIGAGFCVALACDMRFASNQAKLGLNFAMLGIHPGMAATWIVPRLVGPALAAELLYTGRIFGATEAAAMGLVNRAIEPDALLGVAQSVAGEIAAAAPIVNRGIKRALARSMDSNLEGQLEFEAREQSLNFGSHDAREGLAAAREKRAPKFEGR